MAEKKSPRVLIISAAANMIQQFNKRNIMILKELGFEVFIATNFVNYGSMSGDENEKLKKWLKEQNVTAFQVDFKRGIGDLKTNIRVLKKLRKIIRTNSITLVHSQSPIGGVLGRLAASVEHVKSIYTAHGFHFYKDSPLINWLAFYPLEFLLSFITDSLIVINEEDLKVARNFHEKELFYVPGVGVNVQNSLKITEDSKKSARKNIRSQLGLSDNDFLILTVGELSVRKNQEVLIKALSNFSDEHIKVLIAGVGPKKEYLARLSKELEVDQRVFFLGYRNDIQQLHFASDLLVFPSIQEGLALAGLESVTDGLYIIGSDIRGIRDYIPNPSVGLLFSPHDVHGLVKEIERFTVTPKKVDLQRNKYFLQKFDFHNVDSTMRKIYLKYI